jgi:DNA-binding transcriptional regulator YhcF (GntR family)
MEKLTKIVVDCTTGVQEVVELTDAEITQMEADAQAYVERKAAEDAEQEEIEAKKESGKNKLKELGLTDDEINALIK